MSERMDDVQITALIGYHNWLLGSMFTLVLLLIFTNGYFAIQHGKMQAKLQHYEELTSKANNERDAALALYKKADAKIEVAADYIQKVRASQGLPIPRADAKHFATLEFIWATYYNIDLDTGLRLSVKETHFNPRVSWDKSSCGTKQVNIGVWASVYKVTPAELCNDPDTNIRIGYSVLRDYYDRRGGSMRLALEGYRGSKFPRTNTEYAEDILNKIPRVYQTTKT